MYGVLLAFAFLLGWPMFMLLMFLLPVFMFLFFQAEDGIRDLTVTGVQTCALPISIVILENILRHLAQGATPPQAAINGRAEIGLAALAITLVDVVIFAPVGLVSGTIG